MHYTRQQAAQQEENYTDRQEGKKRLTCGCGDGLICVYGRIMYMFIFHSPSIIIIIFIFICFRAGSKPAGSVFTAPDLTTISVGILTSHSRRLPPTSKTITRKERIPLEKRDSIVKKRHMQALKLLLPARIPTRYPFPYRKSICASYRIRTMATEHAGTHKDPVTGEMISKTYVFSLFLRSYF